jgi:hypothetical protein
MAAGWPTKVTYANGDVFNASDINDTNGTLNYVDPTSATNNQVLTRDSAAPGKVKWANSPANTLTTTGDLYYASAANTPARLAIGSASQVLTVSGGIPAWASAGGSYTTLASGTLSGTLSLTSISGAYQNLLLRILSPTRATATTIGMTVNGISTNYSYSAITMASTPTLAGALGTTSLQICGTATSANKFYSETVFYNYASTTINKFINTFYTNTSGVGVTQTGLWDISTAQAITSITAGTSLTGGTYELIGIK